MIQINDVQKNIGVSRELFDGKRKTLLSFTKKYLTQIESAEAKITSKTTSEYVGKLNDQRAFIDSLISYVQEGDGFANMVTKYIEDMLTFYEAEILKGGRICHDVQFWQNQAIRKDKAKRRVINAFSKVLNLDQRSELLKLLNE